MESRERQQQQLVFCLNVGKIHAQLRRLKNESSILDDAVITAIPQYCSKVLFTQAKVGVRMQGIDYYLQPVASEGEQRKHFLNDLVVRILYILLSWQ